MHGALPHVGSRALDDRLPTQGDLLGLAPKHVARVYSEPASGGTGADVEKM